MKRRDVAVIGGGAAGLFASSVLAEAGKTVIVFEPNRTLGRKLRITGKGRCNLTNNCSPEEVMKNILRNPKFLYSSLSKMPPERIMAWLEAHGVPLKTERGRRVFPQSDRASDVADAMQKVCESGGVCFVRESVSEIIVENGAAVGVKTVGGEYFSGSVILSAGGMAYPKTGSDGNGYRLAESLGHTLVRPQPSLVPIEIGESFCASLSGLELKNVVLSLFDLSKPKKPIWSELGEMTFSGGSIAGPLGISASCLIDEEKLRCKGYKLVIDFKPGLTPEQLDLRLQRDIKSSPRASMYQLMRGLLPESAAAVALELLEIDKSAQSGDLSREKRLEAARLLKNFSLTPTALRPFDEAIVTRGGISVAEIYPQSMESRLVKGLYFAGEIIDCDGFTGGYNLTAAFCEAYAAAQDIILNK